ncbi:MAG: hypothetical protein Kow0013_14600 [Pararhodobacter sp.]
MKHETGFTTDTPPTQARFQARPWIDDGAGAPFLDLTFAQGETRVRGATEAFVGHRFFLPGDPRPRGQWGEWAWDGQTLRAGVDPLGYFSLFVYSRGNRIVVSPSILQILAQDVDASVDPVAMAVFHHVGFFVGDDTPFRHIRVLPVGGRLEWTQGALRVTDHTPAPKTLSIRRDAAVEAFIEIPRRAIGAFMDHWAGETVLPLSGGRDSRHVLLEMTAQGRRPTTCLTFHHGGAARNAEVKAASAVATRAGARHTIMGRPRMRLRDSLRGILMTQLCADEHAQMMPTHDFLRGSAAAAIDGIGGDILTNPDNWAARFMAHARAGDFAAIARDMIDGHCAVVSRPGHQGGAGALHSPALREAAIDRMAREIRRHADWPDPYQAFWFYHRTRREIAFTATAVLGGAGMVFCPYLDPDFVELGLSLPWEVTRDQKLHDDAIARAFPDFADIPFAEGFRDDPLPRLRLSRLANALDTLRVAAMAGPDGALRGMRAALAASPLRRGPADIYRLHKAFVEGMTGAQARHLLALDEALRAAAPRGDAVVTEVHAHA